MTLGATEAASCGLREAKDDDPAGARALDTKAGTEAKNARLFISISKLAGSKERVPKVAAQPRYVSMSEQ